MLYFVARKLKKIGQQKNPEENQLVQDLEVIHNASPKSGLTFNSQVVFLNILESIEPEVVNAGHDYCQPDSAATLLTSLNELGERQLVKVVKWAKGLPGRTPSEVMEQRQSLILQTLSASNCYWSQKQRISSDLSTHNQAGQR